LLLRLLLVVVVAAVLLLRRLLLQRDWAVCCRLHLQTNKAHDKNKSVHGSDALDYIYMAW
jgi:hypothetical protein